MRWGGWVGGLRLGLEEDGERSRVGRRVERGTGVRRESEREETDV
jgi:hypothetical protein